MGIREHPNTVSFISPIRAPVLWVIAPGGL